MVTDFKTITNGIAKLIKNDIDIQVFVSDKMNGATLSAQDNAVIIGELIPPFPYFVVNKKDEQHFKNKGLQESNGVKSIWAVEVIFLGDFSVSQTTESDFELPVGAEIEINGITTYTPSDTMRDIARLSAELISKDLECVADGIWVNNYSVVADVYYSEEDGTVASRLDIELYEQGSNY